MKEGLIALYEVGTFLLAVANVLFAIIFIRAARGLEAANGWWFTVLSAVLIADAVHHLLLILGLRDASVSVVLMIAVITVVIGVAAVIAAGVVAPRVARFTREVAAVAEMEEREHQAKAREEFLMVAAHELKTPLTVLQMQTQLATKQLQDGIELDMKRLVDTASKNVQRLMRVSTSILDFANTDLDLQLKTFRIKNLVEEVVQEVVHGARPVEVTGIDGPVYWDYERVYQILSNLLVNAQKFSTKQIFIAYKPGEITVRDQGIGIPIDIQQKIFQHAVRGVSASQYAGFGIGLALAQRIAEKHGGTLTVQSVEGHGATFTLRLPVRAIEQ